MPSTMPHDALPDDAFELIETMLFHRELPLLELHLERLEASARYFDFAYAEADVRHALDARTAPLAHDARYKVRLTLRRDGTVRTSAERLGTPAHHVQRLALSAQRVDPGDVFFYHKTTRRAFYEDAFRQAQREGFDEVLFLNTRGEVTEGARSNVLVQLGDAWYTPPVSCGLLGGVYRRHLLQTRADVAERVLRLEDLYRADALYICNAVRGLREATLDLFGEKERAQRAAQNF